MDSPSHVSGNIFDPVPVEDEPIPRDIHPRNCGQSRDSNEKSSRNAMEVFAFESSEGAGVGVAMVAGTSLRASMRASADISLASNSSIDVDFLEIADRIDAISAFSVVFFVARILEIICSFFIPTAPPNAESMSVAPASMRRPTIATCPRLTAQLSGEN